LHVDIVPESLNVLKLLSSLAAEVNIRTMETYVSGGVEAFAGAAIQLQWLDGGIRDVPKDGAIVLVHVVNPYGMSGSGGQRAERRSEPELSGA
jgi:hypothetical protein